jgi:7-cyano-7-deazaguanine synthase
VLLSGGIDSATCAYLMRKRRFGVKALTFVYGGIARQEVRAAKAIAVAAGVTGHDIVRLPDLREAGPRKASAMGGLPPTYIPMRNAIFYSYAASYAEESGADAIVGGHNRDDSGIFRDVGPAFFGHLQDALWEGSRILAKRKTKILRPLENMEKHKVVALASSLGVPLEFTWSCHRGGVVHCWACSGCKGRQRAFERAGEVDPLHEMMGKIT